MTPIVTVLTRARDLVARPGGWTQRAFARDASGGDVSEKSLNATCFCSYGAIIVTSENSRDTETAAEEFLYRVIGHDSVTTWNDAPERTQAEVVAAFDKAIELAREAGV